MKYSFAERLEFSQGARGERDAAILKNAITGCVSVRKTDTETDKKGVDYVVTLAGGAEIGVDVKTRDKGVSRFWRYGEEELALEVWSVIADEKNAGKVGSPLSDKTNVDMILFTFDESDSDKYFLLPFQLLRMAFLKNGRKWVSIYGIKITQSDSWRSASVFVPATEVIRALTAEMQGFSMTGEIQKTG